MYSQALERTEYEEQTLKGFRYVADKVETLRRRNNLEFGHHREVAPLTPEEQDKWLDIAEEEGLSVHHLRNKIKKEKKEKELANMPEGVFQVIYADPPWSYNDKCEEGAIQSGGAETHYPIMSIDELCEMDMPKTFMFYYI